ncbi:MAG: hypothetical protein OHK0029_32350 [Armatimonadaceae bacterium]
MSLTPLEFALYIPLLVVLAVLVLYASVLAHEIGHVLGARFARYTVTSFGLGTGKPFFATRLSAHPVGMRFYLCREHPLQGITWVINPRWVSTRREDALLLLGGPAANLLLALAAVPLMVCAAPPLLRALGAMIVAINGVFVLLNLIPVAFRIGGMAFRSDGAQLLGVLLRRPVRRPATDPHSLLTFRPLWESIGDTRLVKFHLCLASLAAAEIGAESVAQGYYDAMQAIPTPLPEGYAELTAGAMCLLHGQGNAAVLSLENAEKAFRATGAEAAAWVRTFRRDLAALPLLQETALTPSEAQPAPLITASLAAVIQIREVHRQPIEETLLARWEAARTEARADTLDWATFPAIARWRERNHDPAGALLAYEQAIVAAERMVTALADSHELQHDFAERNRPLLETVFALMKQTGQEKSAERLRHSTLFTLAYASEPEAV